MLPPRTQPASSSGSSVASYGYNAPVLCTATATYYGWLCSWNTTNEPNGTYALLSEAFGAGGSVYSSGVSITASANPTDHERPHPFEGGDTVRIDLALMPPPRTQPASSSCSSAAPTVIPVTFGQTQPLPPSMDGWESWNTTTVPNGSYTLVSEAFNWVGSAFSPGVNIRRP